MGGPAETRVNNNALGEAVKTLRLHGITGCIFGRLKTCAFSCSLHMESSR